MTSDRHSRLPAAAIVSCAIFILIGWSGLLVPSLIRSVKAAFDLDDAGIGTFYLAYASAYAAGSFAGGFLTERIGRRPVLTIAAGLHGLGFIGIGLAPGWAVVLGLAIPAGLGAGALDGGANGLVLDLYRTSRGRALNVLHLFFSLGALSAPLVIGRLVDAGVEWRSILVATGIVAVALAVATGVVAMPPGRRPAAMGGQADPEDAAAGRRSPRLSGPLLLLAVAIGCYVASEIGVSNWLVRFLEPAPLTVATTALALFWAGLTLGRLIAARISDRFDHTRFAIVTTLAMCVALFGAVLAPSTELSIALFTLAGVATGPVYPMIMAIGGDRYPHRVAAVSGILSGAAVVGSIVYPPLMGFLSVTVGLTIAMLGAGVLGLACAAALILVARLPVDDRGATDARQHPVAGGR